jgi:1-acyl-sn-glycerol-3-phosphate acyltransferase
VTAARSLIYNLLSFVWTVTFLTLALPLLLAPPRFSTLVGRIWVKVIFAALAAICGLRYEIRGRENLPDRPCLIAAKHQSAWDTFVFGQILPEPSFVVKRELMRIPLFGWFLRRAGVVPVDRAGGAKALKQMIKDARPLLEGGKTIIIFPEGTRLPLGTRGPYHPGVAALYDMLKVPVVPVALNSGFFWGKRSFLKKPGVIVMEFLPPIAPGLPRREFVPLLQRQIEENSERLLAEARGREDREPVRNKCRTST